MTRTWLASLLAAWVGGAALAAPVPESAPTPGPATGKAGVVATAHPLATQAGLRMLDAGGNAADAAVAAAFALAVVEQYSSGVGGGGFAMSRFGDDLEFLDFREVAPARATRDMYRVGGVPDPVHSRDGILAAGVPGAVAGYLALQRKHGTLSRQQVLAPAIEIASGGFLVSERYRSSCEWRLDLLRADPEASRILLVPGKDGGLPEVPPVGHRIIQEDLAWTLRAIAEDGADAFYRGAVASRLVADMKTRGGLVDAADLDRYQPRTREPLLGSYRGHAIASAPPPSSGGQILLTILNLMETAPADRPWNDPETVHLYIEASKRAFADRALLGDPGYVTYARRLVPFLVAKDRATLLAQVIPPTASPAADVPPAQGAQLPLAAHRALDRRAGRPESKDTTHLSVIDAAGNAVAMTTTVNYGWGSGVIARGTGVIWNDQMDDFAVAPGVPNAYEIIGSEANAVAPGKVPLSSMAPTLVFAGATTVSPVIMVVGAAGGSRIPTTVAQAIIHHIDHHADALAAIATPRIHHQHLPDIVRVEPGALTPQTRAALQAKGHRIEEQEPWSNATAITIDRRSGLRSGAADPRGIGTARAQ